ncbi:DUF6292 family protein [Streptomyces halobius]|uniref:DUF6292 family protein n=1 Tax=Streptomyces halobius TaxID=2879846 RepID=A0ABY4M3B5_9ACTN|nr:DUF6292 family protein [Streptomyces halobius]UQA90731.1 DUF6292 family protein [Streptomyces halobius]
MIRAGRAGQVQTMADLAASQKMSLGRFRNTKQHLREGHPASISSPGAKTLLWDAEQTSAFNAGDPIPDITGPDSDEDLLDRQEAAAELGVTARTWNSYRYDPRLSEHVVLVPERAAGDDRPQVEHWPRGVIRAFKAGRPGKGQGPTAGKPKGSGDMVPRDQIVPLIAELLDGDPAVTAAAVVDELGVAMTTAMRGLAQLRGRRIADLVEAEPSLSLDAAAARLGYPAITRRRAIAAAQDEQRRRAVQPYLQDVADALAEAGAAEAGEVEVLQSGDHLAAAIVLQPGQSAQAVVWDERYGWRTATSRRHPIGKGGAPEGEGIRYLSADLQPKPADVLEALADGRRGRKRPAR